MNPKFVLKVIQQGQTQKANVVTPDAGLSGQALVLQASGAARYQLADVVTLTAPPKLSMKRVGGDLHLALPGSDIDSASVLAALGISGTPMTAAAWLAILNA